MGVGAGPDDCQAEPVSFAGVADPYGGTRTGECRGDFYLAAGPVVPDGVVDWCGAGTRDLRGANE